MINGMLNRAGETFVDKRVTVIKLPVFRALSQHKSSMEHHIFVFSATQFADKAKQ